MFYSKEIYFLSNGGFMFQKIYCPKLVFIFILCSSLIGQMQATIIDCSVWGGTLDGQEKKVITLGEVHRLLPQTEKQTETIQELCDSLQKQGKKTAVLLELTDSDSEKFPYRLLGALSRINNWAYDQNFKWGLLIL